MITCNEHALLYNSLLVWRAEMTLAELFMVVVAMVMQE